MVNDIVVVCETAFWVPVMVSVKVPVAAVGDAETVRVGVAVGVTGVGTEHVTPEGQPVTARSTLPVNPFRAVTVTVGVAVAPWATVIDDGFAEREKSGAVDRFA